MKQLFLSAMISSLVFLGACNNNANSAAGSDSTSRKDSMLVENSSNNMPGNSNNMMNKKGIALSPAQEVPANTSAASGTADVTYNKDSHMLTFTVNWSALTGDPIMAHIHGTAAKGVNAGVKQDLSKLLTKSLAGSFTDSVKVDGSTIKEDSLLAGFYYFNIHTPAHPGGEIRGQIEF